MNWTRSLTLRLTLFFALASSLVLLAVGFVVPMAISSHFEMQDRTELEGKLKLAQYALQRVTDVAELDALPQVLDEALVGHNSLAVAVVSQQGRVLFATSGAPYPHYLLEQRPSGLTTWSKNGHHYRGLTAPLVSSEQGAPVYTVAVALNIDHHQMFIDALRWYLWAAIVLGVVLTSALGWLATRRGLLPLHDMQRSIQTITASQLSQRLPADKMPTELTALAESLNAMLSRLEEAFQRLSGFSADLAHELRTPLSNLITATQVGLSQERSLETYRDMLYSNLEECDRLARMVADMLYLAKADHGLLVPNQQSINLALEVDNLIDFYGALAEEQGVRLKREGEASVQGDALMLRRALSNLLANAVAHTTPQSEISIQLNSNPDNTEISITNPGAEIPAEHLPRLFDRFYRVDPARQRHHEGVGLGLAITKSIVQAHSGAIRVDSAAGLTCFTLSLPHIVCGD